MVILAITSIAQIRSGNHQAGTASITDNVPRVGCTATSWNPAPMRSCVHCCKVRSLPFTVASMSMSAMPLPRVASTKLPVHTICRQQMIVASFGGASEGQILNSDLSRLTLRQGEWCTLHSTSLTCIKLMSSSPQPMTPVSHLQVPTTPEGLADHKGWLLWEVASTYLHNEQRHGRTACPLPDVAHNPCSSLISPIVLQTRLFTQAMAHPEDGLGQLAQQSWLGREQVSTLGHNACRCMLCRAFLMGNACQALSGSFPDQGQGLLKTSSAYQDEAHDPGISIPWRWKRPCIACSCKPCRLVASGAPAHLNLLAPCAENVCGQLV